MHSTFRAGACPLPLCGLLLVTAGNALDQSLPALSQPGCIRRRAVVEGFGELQLRVMGL